MVVTAASGNVGREVVRSVVARQMTVRAVGPSLEALHRDHDPIVPGDDDGPRVEFAKLDFNRLATFAPALQGTTALFLVRPPSIADMKTTLFPFIDAAIGEGVDHIVFLSVIGADGNRMVPHHAVEQYLAEKSVGYTFLRPGFFAQNLGRAYRDDIALEGKLFVPAAHGRVAFVDVRDIAEVAALILEQPELHRGKAYTLTGPEAITFEEVATLLSDVLGRKVRYEPATVMSYVRHLHARGLPLSQVAVQTAVHVGLRYGQAEEVDPTLETLLGRRGHTVERYVRDHHHLWR